MGKKLFINALKNIQIREYTLLGIIVLLLLINFNQSSTNDNLSENKVVRMTITPKLQFGQVVRSDDIDYQTMYQLAGEILQSLNHWADSGKTDYKKNIQNYIAYLTPEYYQYLLNQEQNRNAKGELDKKQALISLTSIKDFKDNWIKVVDNGQAFLMTFDFNLQAHRENYLIQDTKIRYTAKIVIRDIDPNYNPWGWQLDVPPVKPVRIK